MTNKKTFCTARYLALTRVQAANAILFAGGANDPEGDEQTSILSLDAALSALQLAATCASTYRHDISVASSPDGFALLPSVNGAVPEVPTLNGIAGLNKALFGVAGDLLALTKVGGSSAGSLKEIASAVSGWIEAATLWSLALNERAQVILTGEAGRAEKSRFASLVHGRACELEAAAKELEALAFKSLATLAPHPLKRLIRQARSICIGMKYLACAEADHVVNGTLEIEPALDRQRSQKLVDWSAHALALANVGLALGCANHALATAITGSKPA